MNDFGRLAAHEAAEGPEGGPFSAAALCILSSVYV